MKTLLEFQKEYYKGKYSPSNNVIDKYNEYFRDNAQVGDGATVCYWTDRHACTIVKRTPKTLTLRRCKATWKDGYKPEYIAGGFSAHCTNNGAQKWEYEEDEDGEIYKAYWSERKKSFFVHGLRVVSGRHEFYDYNRYSTDRNLPIKSKEVATREIERLAQIQYDLGVGLLGTRITASPLNYKEPFNFTGMIGPIRIYNREKLTKSRYREMHFFSDTDFVLQELLNNRIILRPDYFASDAKLETNKGGMNIRRTKQIQLDCYAEMKKMWGKYVSFDPKRNVTKIIVER